MEEKEHLKFGIYPVGLKRLNFEALELLKREKQCQKIMRKRKKEP